MHGSHQQVGSWEWRPKEGREHSAPRSQRDFASGPNKILARGKRPFGRKWRKLRAFFGICPTPGSVMRLLCRTPRRGKSLRETSGQINRRMSRVLSDIKEFSGEACEQPESGRAGSDWGALGFISACRERLELVKHRPERELIYALKRFARGREKGWRCLKSTLASALGSRK